MSTTEGQSATLTVGSALAASLARSGVKIAFTVPSESILGIIDGLAAHGVRVVATRHEGAASFMAEAVAQLTGRPTLCLAGRAPGAANLAIGLQAAQADSAPVVAIVGQVRREARGRDAFQEMDIVSTFTPLVKWAAEAREAAEVVPLMERALVTAMKGRPGPVLLSIPEDLLDEVVAATGETGQGAAGNHPDQHAEPDPTLVRKVLHLLADARRPLILAGAGILRARSSDALVRFAEQLEIPVVTSWRRPDAFPNENPLYLGMAGPGAPAIPRYSGFALGNASGRRHDVTTGISSCSAKRTSASELRARRIPAPARMSGLRASARRCKTFRTSVGSGSACWSGWLPAAPCPVSPVAATTSSNRSSGIDSSTGPGRPFIAVTRARSMSGTTSAASRASAAHFTRGVKVDTMSISWKASRPRASRRTWPTIATTGAESACAACSPIARFAAPGARPARHRVGRPVS